MAQGTIHKIIGGLHAGLYGLAIGIMQKEEFAKIHRVHIQIFQDESLKTPLRDEDGKFITTLKKHEFLEHIGFQD